MTTVDQFLKALAVVESSDDPEAWGDAGRAMGRWQVHPDRLWQEMHAYRITPAPGETWDQLVARALRAMYSNLTQAHTDTAIAMYWHLGHFAKSTDDDWDAKYAARFGAALANAKDDMP
jgi:hypothetical protein